MLVRSYSMLPCSHDIAPPLHPITLLFVYLVGLASRSACLGCYLYLVVTCIFGAMVSGYLFYVMLGRSCYLKIRHRQEALSWVFGPSGVDLGQCSCPLIQD